jgi:hypothetical protein
VQHLLAVDVEVIVKHSRRPVRIDRDMQAFVHRIVISRTLADDPEVVHEREIRLPILQRALKTLPRYAGAIILSAGRLSRTAESLRLELKIARKVIAIYS